MTAKKTLFFISKNYSIFLGLFKIQKEQNWIPRESFEKLTWECKLPEREKFLSLGLLRDSRSGSLELPAFLFNFISHLQMDFRISLPERFQKFEISIHALYQRLLGIDGSQVNPILEVIAEISSELKVFFDDVHGQSHELLGQAEKLKVNRGKMEPVKRAALARELTLRYVDPLNKIFQSREEEGLYATLEHLKLETNRLRLEHDHPGVRDSGEQFYRYLVEMQERLLKLGRQMVDEILPLLRHIHLESQVYSGFLEFIKHPNRYPPPPTVKRFRHPVIDSGFQFEAEEQFKAFFSKKEVFFSQVEVKIPVPPVFRRAKYLEKLKRALPVENFYLWCHQELTNTGHQHNLPFFFQMMVLPFEPGLITNYPFPEDRFKLTIGSKSLQVPKMEVHSGLP